MGKRHIFTVTAALVCSLALVGCSGSGSGTSGTGGAAEQPGATTDAGGGTDETSGGDTSPSADEAPGAQTPDGGSPSGDTPAATGVEPAASTDSVSSKSGDSSKLSSLKAPDGVSVDMDAVRQAVADAAFNTDLPSPEAATAGSVSKHVRSTDRGDAEVLSWRYVFGEGDAIASVQVNYLTGPWMSEPDVTASISDLRVPSQNKADKSNLADESVDRLYPTISLAGGNVSVGAVSKDTYALTVDFVAFGTKLDREGALPTLTVNGVTMVAEAVTGNTAASGSETRAGYRYRGDFPVTDGKISVKWCGVESESDVSVANMGSRVKFDGVTKDAAAAAASDPTKNGAYQDVSEALAKSISGNVGICHMSAGEIR